LYTYAFFVSFFSSMTLQIRHGFFRGFFGDVSGRRGNYNLFLVDDRPMNADQCLIDQCAQNGAQMWTDDRNPEEIVEIAVAG